MSVIHIIDDTTLPGVARPAEVSDFGGGGAANLASVPSPTGVTITSNTGTDATITGADATNAGVMMPAHVTKLAGVADGATANASDADLRGRATHTGEQAIGTVTGLQAALDGKATAAQGAKADTAMQPGALPVGTTLPAAQISDSGAAGRDILRMATLAEIQSSVSGGAVAKSSDYTLVPTDFDVALHVTGSPTITIPAGLGSKFTAAVYGNFSALAGPGVTINDLRVPASSAAVCVIVPTPSANVYLLVGGVL